MKEDMVKEKAYLSFCVCFFVLSTLCRAQNQAMTARGEKRGTSLAYGEMGGLRWGEPLMDVARRRAKQK